MKRRLTVLFVIFLLILSLMGCTNKDTNKGEQQNKIEAIYEPNKKGIIYNIYESILNGCFLGDKYIYDASI